MRIIVKLGAVLIFLFSSFMITANAQNKVVVIPMAGDVVNNSAGYAGGDLSGVISFGPANTAQTVGSINLAAGSYIVNASLVVNNNTALTENLGCSLRLGSTVIDNLRDTQLFPLGPNTTSGSRESINLNGGGVLAAAGSADVVCRTSSNSGNYLGLSFTAIQVTTLTQVTTSAPQAVQTGVIDTDLDIAQ